MLKYLGRYTHRVAIANERLISIDDGVVCFRWKDYAHHTQAKVMSLPAEEFLRRFLLHVLPSGFMRIRHYGLLANCHREVKLAQCRQLLAAPPPPPPDEPADYLDQYQRLTGKSLRDCPQCGKGQMLRIDLSCLERCRAARPESTHDCSPTTPTHVLLRLCREPVVGHCRLFARSCSSTLAQAT